MPFCDECGYYTDEEENSCPGCGRIAPGRKGFASGRAGGHAGQARAAGGSAHARQETANKAYYAGQDAGAQAEHRQSEKTDSRRSGFRADRTRTTYSGQVYDSADAVSGREQLLGACAYLGFFVFIPLLLGGKNRFVRFHTNQGLVNLIAAAACSAGGGILNGMLGIVFGPFSWLISLFLSLVGIVFAINAIRGVINALSLKMKELPLVGGFRILK